MTTTFLSTIVGSFAAPAAENPTVAIMEASFRATGSTAKYLNCEVETDQLHDAVRGAVAQGWVGFNCSIPHKIAVLDLLDELAPSASIIGAVNCVVINEGRLIGHNTDGRGFVDAVREVRDPAGARAVILGSGGAARAIAVELALAGAEHLTIVGRNDGTGEALADLVRRSTAVDAQYERLDGEVMVPSATTMLVNATPIGLWPNVHDTVPIDPRSFAAHPLVCDVITNPPRTRLIANADMAGCVTVDGQGMLANQAAYAVELWTGVAGDRAAMGAELTRLFPNG
jgi:shikimate dehydrogenase